MEEIILVDEADRPVGFLEKITAHRDGGKLHRAFSIFIMNSAGELLLQRRANGCYHFAGFWTNSCCGHPRRGESVDEAAHRRLAEELGFDVPLREVFSFVYTAHDANSGLTEREYDHVLFGVSDGQPRPCADWVTEVKWARTADISLDLSRSPGDYTPWFHIAYPRFLEFLPPTALNAMS